MNRRECSVTTRGGALATATARTLARALFALAILAPCAAAQAGDTAKAAAAASLYNEEQAARGELVYQNVCIECHELLQYTSRDFRRKWNGRTVFDLYDVLRNTMPDKDPGSLPLQDYIDVTGYMLKLNGVPPGKTALPLADSLLKKIKIDLPPGPAGPLPPAGPHHALHLRDRGHSLVHEFLQALSLVRLRRVDVAL
jgi:hypothetical protein